MISISASDRLQTSSCQRGVHLLQAALRCLNAADGGGEWAFRIGTSEEDPFHRLARNGLDFCEGPGGPHIHWVPAPVDVDFYRINVRCRKQMLEVAQYSCSDLARACI